MVDKSLVMYQYDVTEPIDAHSTHLGPMCTCEIGKRLP